MSVAPHSSKTVAFNTLHSFTPNRLGLAPSLHVRFMETNWMYEATATIEGATQMASGLWNHLVIPAWTNDPASNRDLTGRDILLASDLATVIGNVSMVDDTVHLTAGYATNPTGLSVTARMVNTLGIEALDQIQGGHDWTLILDTGNADHFSRLQTAQVRPGTIYAMQVLGALGLTKTAAEVQAAVVGLAQGGVTIETVLTEEMEKIELERRDGTLQPYVIGTLP